jgi:hypothetical protein
VTGSTPSSRDPHPSSKKEQPDAPADAPPASPRGPVPETPSQVPSLCPIQQPGVGRGPESEEAEASLTPAAAPFEHFKSIRSPRGFACSNPTLQEIATLLEMTLFQGQESPFGVAQIERCLEYLRQGGALPQDLLSELTPEEGALHLDHAQVFRVSAGGVQVHHELRISLKEEGRFSPEVIIGSDDDSPWIAVSWRDQLQNLSKQISNARWTTTTLAAEKFHDPENSDASPMEIYVAQETARLGERVRVATVPRPLGTEEVLEDPRPSLRPEFIDLCASDGWVDDEGEPVIALSRATELHQILCHALQLDLPPPSYESLALTREDLIAAGEGPLSGGETTSIRIKSCDGLLLLVGPGSTGRTLLDDLDSLQLHSLRLDSIEISREELNVYGIEAFCPNSKDFSHLCGGSGIEGLASTFEVLSAFALEAAEPDAETLRDRLIEVGIQGSSCTIELIREHQSWYCSEEEGDSEEPDEEETFLDTGFKEENHDASEPEFYEGSRIRISNDTGIFPGAGPLIELYAITPEVDDGDEEFDDETNAGLEIAEDDESFVQEKYLALGVFFRGEAALGYAEQTLSLARLGEYLAKVGVNKIPETIKNVDFESEGEGRFVMITPRIKLHL